jgi:hypothetical protein
MVELSTASTFVLEATAAKLTFQSGLEESFPKGIIRESIADLGASA